MVAFIACSKTKRKYACAAEKMYIGSLFKKSLAYCKDNFSSIYILSAKYGVLSLDTKIEPYECTLSKMKKEERERWYILVKKQLKAANIKPPYIFLTGSLYKGDLPGKELFGNLSFGKRLQWLNNVKRNNQKGIYD